MSSINPARKRRRPALACEPCRRRKIRCDRTVPCVNCARSNDLACTYAVNRRSSTSAPTGAVDLTNGLPSTQSSPPISEDSTLITSNIGIPGPRILDVPRVQPASLSATTSDIFNIPLSQKSGPAGPLDPRSIAQVRTLVDRVRELERKLADITGHSPENTAPGIAQPKTSINGRFLKTRFFGNSHRSSNAYKNMLLVLHKNEADENSDIYGLFQRCKRFARLAKAQAITYLPVQTDIWNYIPSRQTSDQLIQAYLRTFESVYRIVHVPSFLRQYDQYWQNPRASSPAFVMKILLIMAVGALFYPDQNEAAVLRSSAVQWIYATQTWLSSPFEKSRLDIVGLQVHCLLLLARQTNAVGSDVIWICAGALVRKAMHMGLHIDPRNISEISLLSAELRRRLWATILELDLQSCMDSGNLPLISEDDFDCEMPSNLDDSQLDQLDSVVQPSACFTQASLQTALMRSLLIRLKIARSLNNFKRHLTYEETLGLSSQLTAIYRENSLLLQSFRQNDSYPTVFQSNLHDLMTQRFLLALHDPFSIKAKSNPTFYYSRKVALETSLLISKASHASEDAGMDEDYSRLCLFSGGLFRDVPMQAVSTICEEIVYQLEEDQSSASASAGSPYSLSRTELRREVEAYLKLTLERIKAGESNFKGFLMFQSLLAQIDAMQSGTSVNAAISSTLHKGLETCCKIMEERIGEPPPEHVDSGFRETPGRFDHSGPLQADLPTLETQNDWFQCEDLLDFDVDLEAWLVTQSGT